MSDVPNDPATTFELLLRVWQEGDPTIVLDLVTEGYAGHMLHLPSGERSASMYPDWIARYREDHVGTRFEVQDQTVAGDRLWSRLVALKPDGSFAHGMNVSRFVEGRIAEEWAVWSAWHPA